jgi:pimeloyl-ACP methyl ester carboxylesterase
MNVRVRLMAVAGATAAAMLSFGAAAAVSCESLANLPLAETTITAAHEVPAGSFTPPGSQPQSNLPAFCRVALTVAPAIRVEVWMPKSTWNERYRGEGGGGYAGSISYGGLATGIRSGYATASTDTGHVGGSGAFALNADGTLNQGLIHDFAERSLHEMVIKAKALINAYYGAAPKYSYWNGCSTGGRQGLMAVQRFPEEYDGLVIAAPAINWERFIPAELWVQIIMNQYLGAPISATKLNAVTADAVSACDAADGVADGVINDPRKCEYDPAASASLTPAEAAVVRKIWDGPHGASGQRLWFGLERGASLTGLAGTNPFGVAQQHMQLWVMQSPAFDWKTLTEDSFEAAFRLSQRKFNDVIGTDEDNIQRFRKHGGKILMWHGESDQLIMPKGTLNYYHRLITGNGGLKHVDDFVRLFLAPGVAHCGGGSGPNPVGTFEAVVDWVENGKAPDTIMASRSLGGTAVRTRPLCAYPKTAKWTGLGSSDIAANFVCVDGRHDTGDFKITGPGSN